MTGGALVGRQQAGGEAPAPGAATGADWHAVGGRPAPESRWRRRLRERGWQVYLGAFVAATAGYFLVPTVKGSGALFNVLGLSAAGALLAGARMHRSERRLPWYLLALAQVLFTAGDFLYYTLPGITGGPKPDFPSLGDAFYVPVYPLIIAGLLLLLHARNRERDLPALLDALIIGVSVGVVAWVFLMVPYAEDTGAPLGTKALSIAYPLMDVLVLAVTVRIAVDGGRRPPAFFLIVGGLLALVTADTVYGFIELNGTYNTGDTLDLGWLVYYGSLGLAGLHPSMRRLSEPAGDLRRRLSRRRLLVLAAATLLSPGVLATKITNDQIDVEGALIAGTIALFVLVVVRLGQVVREHERAEDRERALREAGAALVSAPTQADTYTAAIEATRALVGPESRVLLCEAPDGAEETARLDAVLSAVPAAVRGDLLAGRTAVVSPVPASISDTMPLPAGDPLVVAPLPFQDRLGGLLLVSSPHAVNRATRDTIGALASQIALALEATRLARDLHRRQSEARFRSLVQNSSDVVTVVSPDGMIGYQSPSIERVFGYQPECLVGTRLLDLFHPDDTGPATKLLGDSRANQRRSPQLLEARWRDREGAWRHVEMLWTDLGEDPNVGGIVLNTRDISERKAFEERLTHQAFHDPVTGLANRALFRDRVQHALDLQQRDGSGLAVVFMDLDDFKTINDSLGHAAGDQLLAGVAARLRSSVRSADTVARFGGDEFALLLERAGGAEAERVAGVVLDGLTAPFWLEGREVFVRASLGIATGARDAEPRPSADDLLRDADVAMYIAKEHGKGSYRVFEPSMHHMAVRRLELRADLERAVEHDEFFLDYQPVVDLATGRVSGFEALIRWNHPVSGRKPPAEFIVLAEETGLIVRIGKWVLEEACRQAAALRALSPDGPPLDMAVNLSPRQLQHPDLVSDVAAALEASGLPPSSLVLEITEGMVMRDPVLSARRLAELKVLGVTIAVDDFGTGYSSLAYLRRYPIDILKVDRSFVDRLDRSPSDRAIVEAIVHLARVLSMRAIAEGIETEGQLRQLRDFGCSGGQGFHIAAPMSGDDAVAFLRERAAVAAA